MSSVDRIALVTGAGGAVGRVLARALGRDGACVVVNDVQLEVSERVCAEIRSAGGRALALAADVTDEFQVDSMVARAVSRVGPVDLLVNAVDVEAPPTSAPELSGSRWDGTFPVNLTAAFLCCRAVVPMMIDRGAGNIVNVAPSLSERTSSFGRAQYAAFSHALVGFSQQLALELRDGGVVVNVVCPDVLVPDDDGRPGMRRGPGATEPLGHTPRRSTLPDVARAVLFLAGDPMRILTGQVLRLGGSVG